MRDRGGRAHGGTLTLVGVSHVSFGDASGAGRCRLEYVIRLTSLSLPRPRHISQWTSKFNQRLVKSSSGGEAYSFSWMVYHMALLSNSYPLSVDSLPGTVGAENCES